ncbi:hypothetical protein M6D93_11340 [Jatrophihabitans telluris]|uniref:GAF domain-containing protein n=1 Tax=Jatrophihabitans telluris TaxID=2038343 RepID=A0ABY4QT47_9ACTN|nr:hypothetical protein [Jatrophihabitans telluris]UQX86899.1 hypothetical protein M6D93_11340 [Jatrophihabitans telluris]
MTGVDDRGFEARRQASVHAYGLALADRPADPDDELSKFASLARRYTGTEFAAINVIDGEFQVRVAAAPRAPVSLSARSASICAQLIYGSSDGDVFATGDASQHPDLRFNPWVTGELGRLRMFAGAVLVGREDVPLGTLCVWSDEPSSEADAAAAADVLAPLSQALISFLDARRMLHELDPAGTPFEG